MLTRFFELCASEAPENQIAKTMVYQDIPKAFRWDAKTKRWIRRKQFQAGLGRMVHVYENASTTTFHKTLRIGTALLGQEKEDVIKFKTLKSLNDLLQISGYAVADFDRPQLHDFPALVLDSLMRNNLIRRELEGYDQNTLQAIVDQEDQLDEGQRAIFDEIIQATNDPDQDNKLFFIDGPGGTSKSTLLRLVLAKVRLVGKIAIAVASSGIASLLLMGRSTAHSTFKILLKLTNKSTCAIYKQSPLKSLIQKFDYLGRSTDDTPTCI
ncbi:unnamed protein product [Phytophthora fragariaefolia]|uniref:ATP-dependent DNA helicase n=1 Tax=Phytophthora fragariaefolia TaxID=1490495 RepID=A0A9W6Y5F0_9STRA|nr:unnamed protein product [Phytophthora fragariaefolia]